MSDIYIYRRLGDGVIGDSYNIDTSSNIKRAGIWEYGVGYA